MRPEWFVGRAPLSRFSLRREEWKWPPWMNVNKRPYAIHKLLKAGEKGKWMFAAQPWNNIFRKLWIQYYTSMGPLRHKLHCTSEKDFQHYSAVVITTKVNGVLCEPFKRLFFISSDSKLIRITDWFCHIASHWTSLEVTSQQNFQLCIFFKSSLNYGKRWPYSWKGTSEVVEMNTKSFEKYCRLPLSCTLPPCGYSKPCCYV